MNLKGGYQIISLMALSLSVAVDTETYTAISEESTLKQLLGLKEYAISDKTVLPVLLKLAISGKPISVMGELKRDTNSIKIYGKLDGYEIRLSVEYTQDEETLEWYIDTGDAKYQLLTDSMISDKNIEDGIDASIEDGAIKTELDKKASLTGASFTGDIAISGDLDVQGENKGNISATGKITGSEIIENMSGYSFTPATHSSATFDFRYVGVVKNGNKLTIAMLVEMTATTDLTSNSNITIGTLTIPSSVYSKLYPSTIGGQNLLDVKKIPSYASVVNASLDLYAYTNKQTTDIIGFGFYPSGNISNGSTRVFRLEVTFLLSDSLISE